MTKIYYLGTCQTCKRIMDSLNLKGIAEKQEIKSQPVTEEQLEEMYNLAGSYEALFSRRAMKFRQWGLHEKNLTEEDYKSYLLQEYTFLKRPVILINDKIFIGNAKKTVESAAEAVKSLRS